MICCTGTWKQFKDRLLSPPRSGWYLVMTAIQIPHIPQPDIKSNNPPSSSNLLSMADALGLNALQRTNSSCQVHSLTPVGAQTCQALCRPWNEYGNDDIQIHSLVQIDLKIRYGQWVRSTSCAKPYLLPVCVIDWSLLNLTLTSEISITTWIGSTTVPCTNMEGKILKRREKQGIQRIEKQKIGKWKQKRMENERNRIQNR